MSVSYNYLGNYSAAEPDRSQLMYCDHCLVSWTGCWDNFECPICGKGELPWSEEFFNLNNGDNEISTSLSSKE